MAAGCEIVGVAGGRGAPDRGCAGGPEALERAGLAAALAARGIPARWAATLAEPPGEWPAIEAIGALCARLAQAVAGIANAGGLPAVVGGDHSCAIGTWGGTWGGARPAGLVWIDAHMDSHIPATSPTGNLHGMPLACLLGRGDARLTGLAGKAALAPGRVCLVGVRSYEPEEAALLEGLAVRVIAMAEIERRGLDAALAEAVAIAGGGGGRFGVSIDLDAIDPADAPGVGTPEPDGLRADALLAALGRHVRRPGLAGIEIAEYNPSHDRDGRTARLVGDLLAAMIGGEPP